MRDFAHLVARDRAEALRQHGGAAETQYIAGGTTQLDLMKLGVLTPDRLVDIGPLRQHEADIVEREGELRLGAFATMTQAVESPLLRRRASMVSQALEQSASIQIRNMATLGGNLLQRTRCSYYRDPSWPRCNRRSPGTGCSAIEHTAWAHAVLGTSPQCIAVYPGDFGVALIALDAGLEVDGPAGRRLVRFAALHRAPGEAPHLETTLSPGELITAIRIPVRPWFARSRYVKVRDRASYEFALASAAVALDMDGGIVRQAAIGLGGASTIPWRATAAETVLQGHAMSHSAAQRAAEAAFASASVRPDTRARLELGKATLVRALLEVASQDASHD